MQGSLYYMCTFIAQAGGSMQGAHMRTRMHTWPGAPTCAPGSAAPPPSTWHSAVQARLTP